MMWTRFALALLAISIASCGAGAGNKAARDNAMNDSTTVAKFALASSDIQDGRPIPAVYTCDGAHQSPELSWDDPPPGTKSLALIVDDPDAPSGTFHHWGAYDIPATTRSIPRGEAVGTQATNDGGKSGYMGPCPPEGHGPHHYHFKLYALDVGKLGLREGAKIPDVEAAAKQHQIAKAELVATYERK
jgi:hypothetical protein